MPSDPRVTWSTTVPFSSSMSTLQPEQGEPSQVELMKIDVNEAPPAGLDMAVWHWTHLKVPVTELQVPLAHGGHEIEAWQVPETHP